MPSAVRFAFAFALLSGVASGQDFRVVAELGRAGGDRVQSVSVLPLSTGGRPFVVSVGLHFVNAWPSGEVTEPVVSPLADVWLGGAAPVFGDFDGDGRMDLAVATSPGVAILRGDGAGGFTPAAVIAGGERAATAADFNGDGRADLVIASQFSFACYLSAGGFSFIGPRTTAVTTSGGVWAMTPGDVDADGRVDLVVQPPGLYGPVSVWIGVGDGTFVLSGQQLAGDYSVGRVSLADLDGDGLPEIVFANASHLGYMVPLEIYKNDGGGTFHVWAAPQMTRSASQPLVADFDGDGRPDVAFVDIDLPTAALHIAVYRASGASLTEERAPVPAGSRVIAAGDWDGDGRAELFLQSKFGIPMLGLGGTRKDVSVVPVLLSTTGLYGARFDSDLLLTNSGSTSAHLTLRYTAASGGGSGAVERDLAAGRQIFAPSAVGYLRDAGLPIALDGNVIGTLRVEVTGASSPRAVSASVRTTTPAGAGVGYAASPSAALLREPSILPWLVESARDRTNLALVNAGADADGPATLRVTVFPGSPGGEPPVALPDVTLQPGEFFQFGRVLATAGLAASTGWARITRVKGSAPYLAWAAVTDAGSGDGSFEAAVAETSSCDSAYPYSWVVPNAVQTGRYATEFIVTNPGTQPLALKVTLVATGTILDDTIAPGATLYLADLFAELRRRGLQGAPAGGIDIVSPLYIERADGFGPVFAGIRVSSAPSRGVSFGVFESATPSDAWWGLSATVLDLRQDTNSRANLGVVNLNAGPQTFRVDIVDGEIGTVAATTSFTLNPNELRQINAILPALAAGTRRAFARVTPVGSFQLYRPTNFAAYGIVNDGTTPGAGSDDGSYAAAIPE